MIFSRTENGFREGAAVFIDSDSPRAVSGAGPVPSVYDRAKYNSRSRSGMERNIIDRMFCHYNSGEQDASIAATTMMYEAEELGVHSVWLRGFDARTVSEVFDLPENIIPVMMFAMGYPSDRAKPNPWHFKRMPLERFVTEL